MSQVSSSWHSQPIAWAWLYLNRMCTSPFVCWDLLHHCWLSRQIILMLHILPHFATKWALLPVCRCGLHFRWQGCFMCVCRFSAKCCQLHEFLLALPKHFVWLFKMKTKSTAVSRQKWQGLQAYALNLGHRHLSRAFPVPKWLHSLSELRHSTKGCLENACHRNWYSHVQILCTKWWRCLPPWGCLPSAKIHLLSQQSYYQCWGGYSMIGDKRVLVN